MKKKNTFIFCELSDTFRNADIKAIRFFCEAGHSVGVAELISTLSGDDAQALIRHVEISSLMSDILPQNTVRSNYSGLSRWYNPAPRRLVP